MKKMCLISGIYSKYKKFRRPQRSPAYLIWTYHKNISPGALLHTSTDYVQSSSYTLALTLLKSSFSALRNIILSTFLLMQLQRQSVRVMKESIPCELLKFSLSTRHYIPQHMDDSTFQNLLLISDFCCQ